MIPPILLKIFGNSPNTHFGKREFFALFLNICGYGMTRQRRNGIGYESGRARSDIQLGNPQVTDAATELFQKLRDSPPELRRILVRRALAEADALYLFPER
jgi:hypothetical protein